MHVVMQIVLGKHGKNVLTNARQGQTMEHAGSQTVLWQTENSLPPNFICGIERIELLSSLPRFGHCETFAWRTKFECTSEQWALPMQLSYLSMHNVT